MLDCPKALVLLTVRYQTNPTDCTMLTEANSPYKIFCLCPPNSAHGGAKPWAKSQPPSTAEPACSDQLILSSNIHESLENGEDMLLILERRWLWGRHSC